MKSALLNQNQPEDNFSYERYLHQKGFTNIAGCDEVGRGPLAGSVVAAAVILPSECKTSIFLDSKVVSHKKRLELFDYLKIVKARIGIGIVSEKKIDSINILQASLLAMKKAVKDLKSPPADFLLVDGKFEVPLTLPQEPLIKGESRSASIAAASIVAKVTRDAMMDELHELYPQYNFKKNKGYPTKEHRQAIKKYGVCPIHRTTFKGVKEYVKKEAGTR